LATGKDYSGGKGERNTGSGRACQGRFHFSGIAGRAGPKTASVRASTGAGRGTIPNGPPGEKAFGRIAHLFEATRREGNARPIEGPQNDGRHRGGVEKNKGAGNHEKRGDVKSGKNSIQKKPRSARGHTRFCGRQFLRSQSSFCQLVPPKIRGTNRQACPNNPHPNFADQPLAAGDRGLVAMGL